MRVPQVVEGVTHLGFPLHFVTLLGVWKVLGGIAILVPGFARVKEWAYAGMFFDLTGAAIASVASGNAWWHIVAPLAVAVVIGDTRLPREQECYGRRIVVDAGTHFSSLGRLNHALRTARSWASLVLTSSWPFVKISILRSCSGGDKNVPHLGAFGV
jgi:hypothetical protein